MPTPNILVVTNPSHWDLPLESVEIVSARSYLSPDTNERYPDARVFNLCRSYAYQSLGYYVSLLAEARGHRAIPSVSTLRDFRSQAIARSLGDEIDETIQNTLKKEEKNEFSLEIYFGQTLDRAHAQLGTQLYRLFPSPLLRAQFVRQKRWTLASVAPLSLNQLPEGERDRIAEFAQSYFKKRHQSKIPKQRFLFDLAILVNPSEPSPPSDAKALQCFTDAAREVGFFVETITKADADRITEFDALFIRETTSVDHHTYRLSRLAHAEGLVVMDDPWSILRSANKIYLAESMARAKVPTPATMILTRDDLNEKRLLRVQLPCVLKLPDAAFSRGVRKVDSREELREELETMLKESELILAQEFAPSDYDWRIGVLDHKPLYACKYFMAAGHWQVVNWKAEKPELRVGKSETIHVEFAPPDVVETACRAARLIGDGLYGVDLKQVGSRLMVIEVNDNPSIDSGIEDAALGMELYRRIARSFRRRIEQARV
jgi:glutathione synthase/RimK-type ligase-like ATP-grasp enzyme